MKMNAVVVLGCFALAGCASTVSAPPIESADATTVTFIRERAEPTAWNVAVQIDGKELASLSNRSSVTFKLKPGNHRYALKWPLLAGQLDLTGDISFAPNEENYFLITSKYDVMPAALRKTIQMTQISKKRADDLRAKLPH